MQSYMTYILMALVGGVVVLLNRKVKDRKKYLLILAVIFITFICGYALTLFFRNSI